MDIHITGHTTPWMKELMSFKGMKYDYHNRKVTVGVNFITDKLVSFLNKKGLDINWNPTQVYAVARGWDYKDKWVFQYPDNSLRLGDFYYEGTGTSLHLVVGIKIIGGIEKYIITKEYKFSDDGFSKIDLSNIETNSMEKVTKDMIDTSTGKPISLKGIERVYKDLENALRTPRP